MVNQASGQIVCTAIAKGKQHDFKLFKTTRLPIAKNVKVLADTGYQGIAKLHLNSVTPHKRKNKQALTKQQKKENHQLSAQRVIVENVIRKIKIFKLLAEKYRNRRKRFGLRLNLIAAIINYQNYLC